MQDIRYIWIWRDRLNFRPCPVVAQARAHISEQRLVIKPSHSVAHLRVTSCGSLILLKRPCSWFLAVRDSSLGFWDSFFVVLRNHARKNISPCLSSKLTILILFMRMTLSTLLIPVVCGTRVTWKPVMAQLAYHSRICDSVIEHHYQALNLPSFLFHLGSVLVGHVISSFQVSSRFDCAFECLKNELCISYNYQEGNQALHGCELNNQDKGNKPDNFTDKEGFSYYEKRVSNLNLKNLYKNLYVSFNECLWCGQGQLIVNISWMFMSLTEYIYLYLNILFFIYFLFIFIYFLLFLKFF